MLQLMGLPREIAGVAKLVWGTPCSRASRTLFRRCWSNAEANSFVINPLTKIVINQSTLRLTQEHIKQLSDSVKRTQLPKGYLDKTNAEAVKAVNQQIATIIKCEKNIERSCVLCNICASNLYPANGIVTSINMIFSDIQTCLAHGAQLFVVETISPHSLV
ncbi:hypothetical protein Pst134EB_025005 [Puccinia striiformis f. sp. tritici]|nr:hypothetical protein Pst134EB_025005 [Puccinia striiformis f. sp. tritici]